MSRAISCMAWVSSVMMMSRIGISLPLRPDFEQVRLQSFELGAHGFHTGLDVFPGPVAMFQQKRQDPPTIERNQCLDDMVTINHRFVIRGGEFKYSFGPQVRGVVKFTEIERCDFLQFRARRG